MSSEVLQLMTHCFVCFPLCNTSQRDMPAHRGRPCGHNASYGPETKHCMCNPAYSCAGKHCSRAHAVAGGTDRSGFDPQKCRRCACVSADAATQAGRGSAVAGTGVATDTAMPTYSPSARAVPNPARAHHRAAVGGCTRKPYPNAGHVVSPLFPRWNASEGGLDALGPGRKKLIQVGWPKQGKAIGLLLRDCLGYVACPAGRRPKIPDGDSAAWNESPCEDWDLVYGGGAYDGWERDIPWLQGGFFGKMRAHQVFNPCMGVRATFGDKRRLCALLGAIDPSLCQVLNSKESIDALR